MRALFLAAALLLPLAACSTAELGGIPSYDVELGRKCAPESGTFADGSKAWSPVHSLFGLRPSDSPIWFKQHRPNDTSAPLQSSKDLCKN